MAGGMRAGYAAEDGVALHFRGHELEHVLSSRPGASAFRVEPREDGQGGVREVRLPARYLGEREPLASSPMAGAPQARQAVAA